MIPNFKATPELNIPVADRLGAK
eukprot:Gb_14960 [translate_table: standard]